MEEKDYIKKISKISRKTNMELVASKIVLQAQNKQEIYIGEAAIHFTSTAGFELAAD